MHWLTTFWAQRVLMRARDRFHVRKEAVIAKHMTAISHDRRAQQFFAYATAQRLSSQCWDLFVGDSFWWRWWWWWCHCRCLSWLCRSLNKRCPIHIFLCDGTICHSDSCRFVFQCTNQSVSHCTWMLFIVKQNKTKVNVCQTNVCLFLSSFLPSFM